MGRGCQIFVFFASEDVDGDKVALGVTVLAGLGSGHISDLQRPETLSRAIIEQGNRPDIIARQIAMRHFPVYILHRSLSGLSFGWSATQSTIEQPAAAANCTSHQTAHLAGATLDDQKAILAHCACLLGVCQGCTSVSALEMHIVSVVMIVCHVYMHSYFLSGLPTVPSAVHNDRSSNRRLSCSSSP